MRSKSTLCDSDSVDSSPPGSSVHGIFQVRILEWVAISSSRQFFWPRDQTCVSCAACVGGRIICHCFTWEAPTLHLLQPKGLPTGKLGGQAWRSSGACMVCSTLLHVSRKNTEVGCQPPPRVFLNLGTEPVSHVSYTGRWVFVCLFVCLFTTSATWEAQRSSDIIEEIYWLYFSAFRWLSFHLCVPSFIHSLMSSPDTI